MRRLYHYTAKHHAEGIIRDRSIHGGVIPVPDAGGEYLAGTVPGWQWLTSDPAWRQSWATQLKHNCDRTEVRFTVAIPLLELHRLQRWDKVAADYGYDAELARKFREIGGGTDSSQWFIFRGAIPADWIVGFDERPERTEGSGRA
jgi:hypothetical protein